MPTKRNRYAFSALLLVALAAVAAPYWYFTLLQKQLAKKDEEIRLLTKTAADLRAELLAQDASNSAYRVTMEPIRKIALELHPEMGTDTAVFKLVDDLLRVPMLPSSRNFRPLNQTSRSNLVSNLRLFQAGYQRVIRVHIFVDEMSKNQKLLAEEVMAILNEGGLDASVKTNRDTSQPAWAPPPVGNSLSGNGPDGDFVFQLATILRKGMGLAFSPQATTSGERGLFTIRFRNEPSFLPDGSVVLR